jgi:hypothetical protein
MSKSWAPTWAEYFILSDVSSNGVSISFYRASDLMLLRDASQAFPIAELPVVFAVGTPMEVVDMDNEPPNCVKPVTKGDWFAERSSGHAGYRCSVCTTWVYRSSDLSCKCDDAPLDEQMTNYVNEVVDGVKVAGDATFVGCTSGIATDMVNEPPHYKAGDIECIDAIRAALTDDEFRGYCKGNMIKYQWRERLKGGLESIKKAMWYGQQMIKHCKESPDDHTA